MAIELKNFINSNGNNEFRLDFPEFRKLDAIPKRFLYVYVKVDIDLAVYSNFSSFLGLFRIFPLFYITFLSMS